MEMVESRFKMRRKSQKITLENYLDFIDSNKQLDLTVHNLNEKVLVDAVNTIELMDLRRSTLQEEISSEAFVSLDEVIKDLTHINWQECCASSLQTICFSNGVRDSVHRKEKTNASASSMPNKQPPMKKKKAASQQSPTVTIEQVDVTEGVESVNNEQVEVAESVNDEQVAFSGVMCVQSAVGVS
ncbi:hypothetical protein RND71_004713 [Anisodus tanguticus]|uniref:DUF7787 domain-containing protein n=1 Tax=Anisodus tanguticus TaxID=243964 RepID=A0AAE1VRM1_9SOLA|nr:hypothetical protein RND71_004713 [Anisodus tanguticus]